MERKRIIEAGGQIYQTSVPPALLKAGTTIVGPYRVLPGRLSVCRTFGDAEAKLPPNGNPNVVIALPEIKSFKIADSHDFIVMGSDGIFDKLSNKEAIQCVWNSVKNEKAGGIHQQCGVAADTVLKNALFRKSLDNVTVLVIAFTNLKRILKENLKDEARMLAMKVKYRENPTKIINEDKENQSRLGNMIEPRQCNNMENAAKRHVKKELAVISKIAANSTKSTLQKHFDFAAPLSKLETKKVPFLH